jgi:hypothetical protein
MEMPEVDKFWDDLPELVGRDPGMVHGAAVVKDENGELTRLPVAALVENVEAFMEIENMSEPEAIEATLEQFPSTPGGAETIRQLLAYQEAHLHHLQP